MEERGGGREREEGKEKTGRGQWSTSQHGREGGGEGEWARRKDREREGKEGERRVVDIRRMAVELRGGALPPIPLFCSKQRSWRGPLINFENFK